MAKHTAEVIEIEAIRPHPHADNLGLVDVYGYTVVVRLEDWAVGDRAVYIEPDSVVPEGPPFEWLGKHTRIKTRRFRGIYSEGLLMPAPAGALPGADVAAELGITHYEPPIRLRSFRGGGVALDEAPPPPGDPRPIYDLENLRRYPTVFSPGEWVIATEKIRGANARFTWSRDPEADFGITGEFHVGSHKTWKQALPGSPWWQAFLAEPAIGEFLIGRPWVTLYGEIFGPVQSLDYDVPAGAVRFLAFDMWCEGQACGRPAGLARGHWLDYPEFANLCDSFRIPRVPVLYEGPYDAEILKMQAEGFSVIKDAHHIREGLVVRPRYERSNSLTLRTCLKLVSNAYLERGA